MDGGAKVYLSSVCRDYPGDADGAATVYYVLRNFRGEGFPEYNYGDYCVWVELGGVYSRSDKRRNFIGGPGADGGGIGARAISANNFL